MCNIYSVKNIEIIEAERDRKLKEKQEAEEKFIEIKETMEFEHPSTTEER